MRYSTRHRDRYRLAVAAVTGPRQARQARQSGTTVLRERPTGTRVTTRYVTGAAAGGTASVRSGAPPATTQGQPQSQPVQQTQPAPPQAPSVPKPTPKTSGS